MSLLNEVIGDSHMTSEEINSRLTELDGSHVKVFKSAMGDKVIPYIGWYWREVDFDADSHRLGILPIYDNPHLPGIDTNDSVKVGFMENNKWGYETFMIEGDEWKKLRELIEQAVTSEEEDDFAAVESFMQSLLPEGKESLTQDPEEWM